MVNSLDVVRKVPFLPPVWEYLPSCWVDELKALAQATSYRDVEVWFQTPVRSLHVARKVLFLPSVREYLPPCWVNELKALTQTISHTDVEE